MKYEYILKQLSFTISMFKNIEKSINSNNFFYSKEKDELIFKDNDVVVSKIDTTITVTKNNQIIFKSNPKQIDQNKENLIILSNLTNELNKIFINSI